MSLEPISNDCDSPVIPVCAEMAVSQDLAVTRLMKMPIRVCFSLQAPTMAHFFKERSACPFCQRYLERPMYLKCGYVCCLRCIDSLEKIPKTGGTLCPNCSVVSLKEDILPAFVLGRLTAKIKELEEHLNHVLKMNPRMKIFQGKNSYKHLQIHKALWGKSTFQHLPVKF